eukprot:161140_1
MSADETTQFLFTIATISSIPTVIMDAFLISWICYHYMDQKFQSTAIWSVLAITSLATCCASVGWYGWESQLFNLTTEIIFLLAIFMSWQTGTVSIYVLFIKRLHITFSGTKYEIPQKIYFALSCGCVCFFSLQMITLTCHIFELHNIITSNSYFIIAAILFTSEQVFDFLEPLISTLPNDILNTLRSELTLHGINGESLIFFNNSHLNELHITNIDHQNIIMKAINSLYDSIVLSQYISKFSQFQYSMISQSIMDTEINLESLKNQGHQQSFYKNILNIRNDNIINEFIQTFAMIFNHKTNDNNHKKNCSNTHELSTLPFSALIVAGYIHDIEVLLKNRLITVMPDDIIFLCYQFYKHCTRLAITYKNNTDDNGYREIPHFGIMDIQSKYISHIQPFNSSPMSHKVLLNISYAARLSCYIPNITFNTEFERLTHNGSNDAIFGAFVGKSKYGSGRKDSKEYVYPCFSLFSSHNYETDDVYYHIISKRKMCGFKRALYCKERNSIFGEFEGILYELKLANVTDLNFRFKKLYSKQPQIWNHHRMWKYSQKYLVMEYMNDMDRIFGISCHSSRQMRRPRGGNGQIKCGLYDFKLNRWNDICSFKYESNPSIGNVFSCKTCYDRKQNFIYMKSNIGHTARYDGNENKWQIFINTKFGRNHRKEQLDSLWIDKQNANILYCAHIEDESIDRSDNGYAPNKKIVFKQLDLRMHCMEWMKIDECSIKQARKQGCNVSIMTGN